MFYFLDDHRSQISFRFEVIDIATFVSVAVG